MHFILDPRLLSNIDRYELIFYMAYKLSIFGKIDFLDY